MAARRLAPEQVRLARAMYAAGGWSQSSLGRLFRVSQQSMRELLTGRTYADVDGGPGCRVPAAPATCTPSPSSRPWRRKLSDDQVAAALRAWQTTGVSIRQLAEVAGVDAETLRQALREAA